MSKVYARKQGKIHTVFLDNGQPLPITDFDQEPMGFPQTFMSEGAVRAAFPGRELVCVEQKRPEEVLAKRPADTEVDKLLSATPTAPVQPQPQTPQSNQSELARALQYFKILVAQESVAAKNKEARVKLQIDTCAALIQAVWPGSEEQLIAARNEMKGFRF